ncbi:8614_t:CDS:1, partial [Funneliformis caledonium]
DDFYQLNSILVNWDKSVLLTSVPIVSSIHFRLAHNEEWIKPMDPKSSTRYL